ncbi:hypothetical protein DIX60_10725 [Streptococcus iniae]|uniref:CPBP family intramembrane glutamic endopeptidase n=1 Tax=Streptococcus iniae TaxID=1346 RepID=UPI000EF6E102|nr:CPBP family intramembrane glutamic endopeptidase [Streptococcus iniae]RLV26719.1 hypothetical protein DIX60_10725 [Streptococcus iniae]
MRLLKLCSLFMVTILLSLVLQIPIYIGITILNENVIFKIIIAALAFSLIFGVLYQIRLKIFPNIPVNKSFPLRTTLIWTISTFLLIIGIKLMLQFVGINLTSANNDDIIQQLCSPNMWLMMVSLHFTGPILEELVFRGILLEGLIRLYPNKKVLILILSSFLFAYTHTYTLSLNLLDYFEKATVFCTRFIKCFY